MAGGSEFRGRSRSRSPYRGHHGRGSPGRGMRRRSRSWSRSRSPPRRRYSPGPAGGPGGRKRWRDDYDDDRGGGGYAGGRGPPRKRRNRHKRGRRGVFDGPLLSYKQFMNTMPDDIAPGEADHRYQEYCVEYRKRDARSFFDEHWTKDWFRALYDDSFKSPETIARHEAAQSAASELLAALADKSLDVPVLNDDTPVADDDAGTTDSAAADTATASTAEGDAAAATPAVASIVHTVRIARVPPSCTVNHLRDLFGRLQGLVDVRLRPTALAAVPPSNTDNADPNTPSSSTPLPPATSAPPAAAAAGSEASVPQPGAVNVPTLLPAMSSSFTVDVMYSSEASALDALRLYNNWRMPDFIIKLERVLDVTPLPDGQDVRRAPVTTRDAARIDADVEHARMLIERLDSEKGVMQATPAADAIAAIAESVSTNPMVTDVDLAASFSPSEWLDRMVAYLRRVHNYCLYCSIEFVDADEMTRLCGTVHRRGLGNTVDGLDGAAWYQLHTARVRSRLSALPSRQIVARQRSAIARLHRDLIISEPTQKCDTAVRCVVESCRKRFRAENFAAKHINAQHTEQVQEVLKKAVKDTMYSNFMCDPNKYAVMMEHNPPPPATGVGAAPSIGLRPVVSAFGMPMPLHRVPASGGRGLTDPRATRSYVDLEAAAEPATASAAPVDYFSRDYS